MSAERTRVFKVWDTNDCVWMSVEVGAKEAAFSISGEELFFSISQGRYYRMLDHLFSDVFLMQFLHEDPSSDELFVYMPGYMSFLCGEEIQVSLGELYKDFCVLIPQSGNVSSFESDSDSQNNCVPVLYIHSEAAR